MSDPTLEFLADVAQQIRDLKKRVSDLESIPVPGFSFGTWNPTLAGQTTPGTFTYAASGQLGHYTRLGNRLFFNIFLSITARPVAPTGNLIVTGFPVTSSVKNTVAGGASVEWGGLTLPANFTYVTGTMTAGATILSLQRAGSAQAAANVQGGEAGTAISLFISGSYLVD